LASACRRLQSDGYGDAGVGKAVRAQRRRFSAHQDSATALHESAHALIATVVGIQWLVDLDEARTTIKSPDGNATLDTIKDHLTALLPARAAELIILGAAAAGAVGDLETATAYATNAIAQFGLEDHLVWLPDDNAIDDPWVRQRRRPYVSFGTGSRRRSAL